MRATHVILGCTLAACGCAGGGDESSLDAAPVLIVGVDGFEWNVILPLIAAGEMPALAGLMERGVYGTLSTLSPTKSPRLWTTIATGKLPEDHGILGFTKAGTDPKELYSQLDRRVKAYWNILADHGISSDTIGWWVTFPVEEVPGWMVAQTNSLRRETGLLKGTIREGSTGQVWPPEAEDEVFAKLELIDQLIDQLVLDVFGESKSRDGGKGRWHESRWSFRADATYHAILKDRISPTVRSQVTTMYIGGTDVVGHRFWSAYEPGPFDLEPDSEEVQHFSHVIPAYYTYVDDVLADLLESFPGDATVFVLADHGMAALAPRYRRKQNTGGHKGDPGVFVAAGRGIARRVAGSPITETSRAQMPELGGIADFCPTLLAVLGIPHGEDMEGRPILEILDPAFLADHPITSVPTHDDDEWLASRSEQATLHSAQRLEQLQDLGYIGDDGEEED